MMWLLRLLLLPVLFGICATAGYASSVPQLLGHVNDYGHVLSQAQSDDLENALRALEDKTTAQVVILTMPDLAGADIATFSIGVGSKWKLGQKGKDNGLLIVYAMKEDRYRIEVGYGLEGAIPDGVAGDIIRNQLRAKADPKKGTSDFGGAFTDAVQKISDIIEKEYAQDPSGASMKKHSDSSLLFNLIANFWYILLIIPVVILAALGPRTSAVIGACIGAVIAFWFAFALLWWVVSIVLGAIIGALLSTLADGAMSGGGYSGGWSGGGGGGGFGGGGGGFGGGGASG